MTRILLLSLAAAITLEAGLTVAYGESGTAAQSTASLVLRSVSWPEAQPLARRLIDVLPADLLALPEDERPLRWRAWVEERRAAVMARVARGEDDSVVNLLLFGTTFTAQPRITPAFVATLERQWRSGGEGDAQEALLEAYAQRARDLVGALAAPGADERLRLARMVLERQGADLTTLAGRDAAAGMLLAAVVRVREESAAIARSLQDASRLPDPSVAFAERSRVFRDRGLAPDSTVLTQYAVDRALDAVRTQDLLTPARVTRVAIVGPGLDIVDKQEGYDFYPPQSLQPFAVVDSLVRTRLATVSDVQVATFDVSARVNAHLRDAVDRARRRTLPYRVVLPFDSAGGWREEPAAYWRTMGSTIGTEFEVAVPAGLTGVRARGMAIRPSVVAGLDVHDGNIVFERADLPAGDRFDLVVATNVLVYYDLFEQALAFANLAEMLRPGGLLVTNTALPEVPEIPMRSVGYLTVPYSDREGDGERVVLYQRGP